MLKQLSAWWRRMANGLGEDRIIVHYDARDAIDIEDLSGSLTALARQYRRTWRLDGRRGPYSDLRLLVTKVESGSIVYEIAAGLIILRQVYSAADYILVFDGLVKRIGQILNHYAKGEERPDDLNTSDARDIRDLIRPLTGRNGASLHIKRARIRKTTPECEILGEYEFDGSEIQKAEEAIAAELEGKKKKTTSTHRNAFMYWHQTNRDEGKDSDRTGDLAVVPSISHEPLPALFPSETASLKREMMETRENPFNLGFFVDVNAKYVDGEATAYGLLALHRTIPLGDTERDDGDR